MVMEELAMDKQQTQHLLEKVVLENSNDAVGLSVQMTELRVVQSAVAKLMNRIDEMTENGWHEDRGMAYLSIQEIQDTVRLIDMAFYPLFKRLEEDVNTVNIHAQEMYETLIKGNSEQSSKGVAHETESQIVSAQNQEGVSY